MEISKPFLQRTNISLWPDDRLLTGSLPGITSSWHQPPTRSLVWQDPALHSCLSGQQPHSGTPEPLDAHNCQDIGPDPKEDVWSWCPALHLAPGQDLRVKVRVLSFQSEESQADKDSLLPLGVTNTANDSEVRTDLCYTHPQDSTHLRVRVIRASVWA